MYKHNMTSQELVKESKLLGITIKEAGAQYKSWQVINKAEGILPSEQLEVTLGNVNPAREAMMMALGKAVEQLETKDTVQAGTSTIIKIYDSLSGNKGNNTNVNVANSTYVNAMKADSLSILKKMAGIEEEVVDAEIEEK